MEQTDKYIIAYKGLGIGKHTFNFTLNEVFFKAYENSEICKGNAQVQVILTKGASLLELQVAIDGQITVNCDRCLEELTLPVHYDNLLLVKFSEITQEFDGEVLWLQPNDSEINLAQYFYESIVLSLPYQRVHPLDENGNSSCNPEMLRRFSIVSEEEFEQKFQPKNPSENKNQENLEEFKHKLK